MSGSSSSSRPAITRCRATMSAFIEASDASSARTARSSSAPVTSAGSGGSARRADRLPPSGRLPATDGRRHRCGQARAEPVRAGRFRPSDRPVPTVGPRRSLRAIGTRGTLGTVRTRRVVPCCGPSVADRRGDRPLRFDLTARSRTFSGHRDALLVQYILECILHSVADTCILEHSHRTCGRCFHSGRKCVEGHPETGWPSTKNVRRRPTLPRSPPRSTIGAEGLSFRVRNGTGRFPFAMAAETLWRCRAGSRPYLGNRTVDA